MDTKQELSLTQILLIDDQFEKFIDSFSFAAEKHGLKVVGCCNIEEGFKLLTDNKKKIGAVLLDLSFSPNNYEGVDALITIKKTHPLIPVIILTGGVTENELNIAISCIQKGAFHYIKKNEFDITSIINILKIAISKYTDEIETERYNFLKEEFRNKVSAYEKMIYTTEMILNNILNGKLMFPPTFEGRTKTFKSFYKKLLLKEQTEGFIEYPFERIKDIAGLRVIFFNSLDLRTAVNLLLNSDDFIGANPESKSITADDKSKSYGYRAVHFDIKLNSKNRPQLCEYQDLSNIPCEIQFKTVFAHSWSKVYHVLSYKEIDDIKLSSDDQDQLDADFIEAAKNLESIEQQITSICEKYYPKTI